jgi:hypothetical protein
MDASVPYINGCIGLDLPADQVWGRGRSQRHAGWS